jgi:hypothetical protein
MVGYDRLDEVPDNGRNGGRGGAAVSYHEVPGNCSIGGRGGAAGS